MSTTKTLTLEEALQKLEQAQDELVKAKKDLSESKQRESDLKDTNQALEKALRDKRRAQVPEVKLEVVTHSITQLPTEIMRGRDVSPDCFAYQESISFKDDAAYGLDQLVERTVASAKRAWDRTQLGRPDPAGQPDFSTLPTFDKKRRLNVLVWLS